MRKPLVGGLSLSTEGDDLAGCAGYLGYPFEKIGMVCMIDHVSLLKHVRCEYNERDLFCSYASSQPARRGLRVRQDPHRLRLPVGPRPRAHHRAAGWTGSAAPPSPAPPRL